MAGKARRIERRLNSSGVQNLITARQDGPGAQLFILALQASQFSDCRIEFDNRLALFSEIHIIVDIRTL